MPMMRKYHLNANYFDGNTLANAGLTDSSHRNPNVDNDAFRGQDPTPQTSHETWRYTPSLLGPTSYAFNGFASAQSGYTPAGYNKLFHSQAGDLHSPTLGVGGIGTSLFMANFGNSFQSGAAVMDVSHQFHHMNPFTQKAPGEQAVAPTALVHQDTGYETMQQDEVMLGAPQTEHRHTSIMLVALQQQTPTSQLQMSRALPPNAEKFRFHATLKAPTAMIKHADEIPVTYLNKGQAYSLSVVDTTRSVPIQPGTKYKTSVRISFEEEEQRQNPSVCWGMWKDGRGTDEAHQRGGKLQAVEYVAADQPADTDDNRPRIELESSSFDGFCVTWTPGASGSPEINLNVRFNFLSTDFSRSKGVKGLPVRLCAKTNIVPPDASLKNADIRSEVCFCKVQLFRDHGAERRLSNDIIHVKKSMDKLKQPLELVESGMRDVAKRKISNDLQSPGNVQKSRRTWSMSSAGSARGSGSRTTLEKDLQIKLQTLQDMLTSTRPVSILCLRGENLDDPDLHPVFLPGSVPPPNKLHSLDGSKWQARSTKSSVTGSMVSPSPSSLSLASQASGIWKNMENATSGKTFEQVSKINRIDTRTLSGWIDALGVDPSERIEKPVACFYVQYLDKSGQEKSSYHRAIYLSKRTREEFNGRVASKWGIEPSQVLHSIRVIQGGLEIEMDDDVIRELKEGQDMRLEVEEVIDQPTQAKHGWEMGANETGEDSDDVKLPTKCFVLRLTF